MKKIYFFAFLALFLVSGCANNSELQSDELSGTVRVSGAWALYPMMVKWGEEFQKIHPNVRVDVSAGGAGKGAADALGLLVDIGMISREISAEEVEKGAFFVPVVKDAVFPVMSSKNPFYDELSSKGMKRSDFVNIWIDGDDIYWNDLVGSGIKEKVVVYTRSDACGAADTWATYLGGKQEDLQGIGVYGDPGLAEAVNNDLYGVGYNNLNYAFDFNTGMPVEGLKIIPIDMNENGMIDPEEEIDTKQKAITAIVLDVYPSPPARDLYLMTKGSFEGLTKEFVKYILTDGQQFVDETGYIKLGESQLVDARQKVYGKIAENVENELANYD